MFACYYLEDYRNQYRGFYLGKRAVPHPEDFTTAVVLVWYILFRPCGYVLSLNIYILIVFTEKPHNIPLERNVELQ